MLSSPPKISLLPEHLIDQIKAGEVIERPGNLVKEILENAIDAGSTRLELSLKNNGLDLISLKDNGHGILSQDLPLAFSRHATSKISRFEDLYRLHSFGFRGEALASISAISKIQCLTFNGQETEGSEIRIEGGLTTYTGRRQKSVGQSGTELSIQELFFNTPVRLKFIQSQLSEKNFLKKIIFSFILAHPKVEFIIKIDEDEKEVFPARNNLSERLADIIPKSRDLILHSQKNYEDNRLELFIIPGNLRSPVKLQYAFINQRFVIDKQILRVISNALMSAFGHDDFHFIAFVDLPADHIDVNVHPNKTIIKLFESSKVIGLISGAIKDLASPQSARPTVGASVTGENQSTFTDFDQEIRPTLLQERHDYNMSGLFSPHQVPLESQKELIWIHNYFLHYIEGHWMAIAAGKLLSVYVHHQLSKGSSPLIPLLVSEPFKFDLSDHKRVQALIGNGIELETLSPDTLVLRSIPEWMNGFPLKDIIVALIKGQALDLIRFEPRDWSQTTWTSMIEALGVPIILEQKIGLDLKSLLSEKL